MGKTTATMKNMLCNDSKTINEVGWSQDQFASGQWPVTAPLEKVIKPATDGPPSIDATADNIKKNV